MGEIARLDSVLFAMQLEDRQAGRVEEQQQLKAPNPLDAHPIKPARFRLTSSLPFHY